MRTMLPRSPGDGSLVAPGGGDAVVCFVGWPPSFGSDHLTRRHTRSHAQRVIRPREEGGGEVPWPTFPDEDKDKGGKLSCPSNTLEMRSCPPSDGLFALRTVLSPVAICPGVRRSSCVHLKRAAQELNTHRPRSGHSLKRAEARVSPGRRFPTRTAPKAANASQSSVLMRIPSGEVASLRVAGRSWTLSQHSSFRGHDRFSARRAE